MSVKQKLIVLLKAVSDENYSYEVLLKNNSFSAFTLQTLVFEYLESDVLYKSLLEPELHSGLVFTSPRSFLSLLHNIECVIGTENTNLSQKDDIKQHILDKWKNKPCFAVGETTAKSVQKFGLKCLGTETGNAQALGSFIGQNKEKLSIDLPLLAPSSNLKRSILKDTLEQYQIQIEEIVTYHIIQNPNLFTNLEEFIKNYGIPEYWVFFSPSGVKFVLGYLKEKNLLVEGTKLIAIGPTTGKAITDAGYSCWNVAKQPSPDGVLEAIQATIEIGSDT